MLYVLLVAAAVLPALLLVWFFHARDTFPEPPRVLWTTFGLGCLSVVPAVALGLTIEPVLQTRDALSVAAFQAFVIAALCEEAAKLSVLLGYSFRRSEFDEAMDGVVYGAAASLGFATLENTLYVLDGGFAIAIMRGVLSVPGHATYGAVMGYYVGRARFDAGNRWRLVGLGLLAAVLLHGFYDLPLMLMDKGEAATEGAGAAPPETGQVSEEMVGGLLVLGIAAVVVGWTWSLKLVQRVRREQRVRLAAPPVAVPVLMADGTPGLAAATWSPTGAVAGNPAPSPFAPRSPRGVPPANLLAAWVAVISGGLVATAGGLLVAIAVAVALAGQVEQGDLFYFAVGISVAGVAPALAGAAVFAFGVRVLNRAGPAAARGAGPAERGGRSADRGRRRRRGPQPTGN